MARLQASKGVSDAAVLSKSMGDLRLEVAQHAIDVVKAEGPLSAHEAAAAQVWFDSIYGTQGETRDLTLTERSKWKKRLKEIEADARANPQDAALQAKLEHAKQVVAGFDAFYKGLPEEIPAYEQGGIVKAEARLMEAQRQLDLSQIALDHAQATRIDLEQQTRAVLDSGGEPDASLAAGHQRAIERVQRMAAQRDAARGDVAAAERIVAGAAGAGGPGGGGPTSPGGGGSATPTASDGPSTITDATPTVPDASSTVPDGSRTAAGGPPPPGSPARTASSADATTQPAGAERAETPAAPGPPPVRGEGHAPRTPVTGAPPVEPLQVHGWTEAQAKLGGLNEEFKIVLFEHASQRWWLFKPAQTEANMALGPGVGIEAQQRWRRAAAAAALGGRLNFETPGVRLVEWNGQVGSLQEFRQGLTSGSSMMRNSPAEFDQFWNSQQRRDMDAFDFLIANQDRHPGNFMFDGSTTPPRLVLVDQDAAFPSDARRGYQAQEPGFEQPDLGREHYVRDLPPAVSADLAERLIDLHENFPEPQLREWLTADEVDGLRSRLGVMVTKLNNGQIRMIHPD
jgi:hypothetical protein